MLYLIIVTADLLENHIEDLFPYFWNMLLFKHATLSQRSVVYFIASLNFWVSPISEYIQEAERWAHKTPRDDTHTATLFLYINLFIYSFI